MRYASNHRCTYRGIKIHLYTHWRTGPDTWYYRTRIQNGGNFASQAAALDAAKIAVDKHIAKEAAKA